LTGANQLFAFVVDEQDEFGLVNMIRR